MTWAQSCTHVAQTLPHPLNPAREIRYKQTLLHTGHPVLLRYVLLLHNPMHVCYSAAWLFSLRMVNLPWWGPACRPTAHTLRVSRVSSRYETWKAWVFSKFSQFSWFSLCYHHWSMSCYALLDVTTMVHASTSRHKPSFANLCMDVNHLIFTFRNSLYGCVELAGSVSLSSTTKRCRTWQSKPNQRWVGPF